jgi:hypothetical protein
MRKTLAGVSLDFGKTIRQVLIAGGLYKLARKSVGRGLFGLALPLAALLIEDLSNPKGVVLPFIRWIMSSRGKVKIIEMSGNPLKKPDGEGRDIPLRKKRIRD